MTKFFYRDVESTFPWLTTSEEQEVEMKNKSKYIFYCFNDIG